MSIPWSRLKSLFYGIILFAIHILQTDERRNLQTGPSTRPDILTFMTDILIPIDSSIVDFMLNNTLHQLSMVPSTHAEITEGAGAYALLFMALMD